MDDSTPARIEVSVLGPIEVRRDGEVVDLGTPRQRAIMAALALSAGRVVPFDVVVDRVWGGRGPATAISTMQRYVATLRQLLEPQRHPDARPLHVVTERGGYALHVPDGGRDVDRLERAVAQARRVLAGVPDPQRPVAAPALMPQVGAVVGLLDQALEQWRGEPYADLVDHDARLEAERTRLRALRDSARELRVVALLALGRHSETVGELEGLTARHPLHERWWALRAVALVRCGRQAEALDGLATMRELLAEELGVDPSPPLQTLLADILRQADSLRWSHDRAGETTSRSASSRPAHRRVRAPRAARARCCTRPSGVWLAGRD